MREKLREIGSVEVGEWVMYDWKTWREVEEVKSRTRYFVVFRLVGYPIDCSCAPDVEFPWSAERPVQ